MPVIWGRSNSVNVQKVLWCCEELHLPYDRIDAGGPFGMVDSSPYRTLNPNGLVPTIDDDGFTLWESNAIVRYLTAKHSAGSLWPSALHMRADADRWMDWENTTLWPALRPLFLGLVRTDPDKRDPRAMDEARQRTIQALRVADSQLATRPFLAGDPFTMGDIPVGCAIWRWMALPINRPSLPNVKRWFDSLTRRSAYEKVVMLPLT